MAVRTRDIGPSEYKYGFRDAEDQYVFKSQRGLSAEVVRSLSAMKGEPEWMLRFRLRALELFYRKPMPKWGADLSEKFDLTKEDRADDLLFNEVIWRSVKGAHAPMPAPVRAAWFFPHKTED